MAECFNRAPDLKSGVILSSSPALNLFQVFPGLCNSSASCACVN